MPQLPRSGAIDSWKERSPVSRSTTGRMSRRLFVTALFVLLIGLLVWVLSGFWSRTSLLVSLPIVHQADLGVPPVAYWAEDTRAFLDLAPASARDLDNLDTYGAISTLEDRLRAELARAGGFVQPRLIVQIAGQGVSDDGQAWLLCSDYSPQKQENRYHIGDLLRAVSKCPAQRKIVILDASHILADPRLGMVINEFPRLLEDEVRGIPDPDLWVLASCSPGEISQACRSGQRSVFGGLVTQGLHGAADANADGVVDLDELFHYVRNGAAAWGRAAGDPNSEPTQTQTPRLLQGGKGAVAPPSGIALRPISSPSREAGEPSVAKDSGKDSAAGVAKDSGKDSAAAAAALPGGGAGQTAAARPSREDAYLELWQLHDRLQNRVGDAWTPIDYAPDQWRQWQAQLIALERLGHAGSGYEAQLAGKCNAFCGAMANWLAKESSGDLDSSDPLAELHRARRRFQADTTEHDRLNKELRAAIQLRNELAYQAPYYVRWHAGTLRLSTRQHRLYPEIVRLLQELRTFSDDLDKIGAGGETAASEPSRLSEQCARRAQDLKDRAKHLQEGLRSDAGELLAAAAKTPGQYDLSGPMDALLATPLLPARLRIDLLTARDKLAQPLPEIVKGVETASLPRALFSHLGARLKDQAVLEHRLVALAGADAEPIVPPTGESWDDGPSQDKAWMAYRKFGNQLEAFYRSRPERVNELNSTHKVADARRSNCSLRLVDARDATLVKHELVGMALPVEPVLAAEIALAVSPGTLTLNSDKPSSLQIDVQVKNATAEKAELRVAYDASQLQITKTDDLKPLPPNEPVSLSLTQNAGTASFAVVPQRFSGTSAVATFEVSCLSKTSSAEVRCKLPMPDRFELVAERMGGREVCRAADDGPMVLRPFPNRQTRYRFQLVNQSGRARRLLVDWYAIAKLGPRDSASQNGLTDERGELLPGVENEKLGRTMEVALPAGEQPQPMVFPEAKPPADKAEKAAGGTPPAVASGGLICLLRDAASKEFKGLRWLRFRPLSPADYVQPTVNYVYREGRIEVEVEVPREADFPPLSEKNTVQVSMDIDPPAVAGLKNHAEIITRDTPALLFAEVKPEVNQHARVSLTIDDYPRALLYDVECERRDHVNVRPKRDESAIRIVVPKVNQAYRTPLSEPVRTVIQVDAPAVAFRDAIPGGWPGSRPDLVKLGVFDAGDRRELCPATLFYTDRLVKVSYEGGSAEGYFQVFAKVGDFEVFLPLDGLENQRVLLRADLLLATRLAEELRHKTSDVPIVLDGNKPEFIVHPAGPFIRGQEPIKVFASVQKVLSGIEKVEVGMRGKKEQEFAPAPETVAAENVEGSWVAKLPTADLKAGDYTVLACVTSRVGLKAWKSITVRLNDPPPPPAVVEQPPPPKAKSIIEGTVVWKEEEDKAVPGLNVSLREAPELGTKSTGGDGTFRFSEVPAGTYTLEVEGFAKGHEVKANKSVTVPGPSEPTVVKIMIRW